MCLCPALVPTAPRPAFALRGTYPSPAGFRNWATRKGMRASVKREEGVQKEGRNKGRNKGRNVALHVARNEGRNRAQHPE